MKHFLVLIMAASVIFSCKKDNKADPALDTFAGLRGKYFVCDSNKTTINGTTTTRVLGKGKGADLSFGLYGNLDIYTSPITNKSYMFESPNKIYYWTTAYQSNQFYTIQSMSANKIVLVSTEQGSGKVLTEYFTAE